MSDSPVSKAEPSGNAVKDPEDWVNGVERLTGAPASYRKTLSAAAGREFDEDLTKSEASKTIDELQDKTGRGAGH